MHDLDERLRRAIRQFWKVRDTQAEKQGGVTGRRDAGLRTAVTGGKHLYGMVELCRDLLISAGLSEADVYCRESLELPGYFRSQKNWDLLTVVDGHLLAVVEFKAQVGPSFGNNFNNRAEEALGNATDLWAAYREGAFQPSARPWLGYVFILEDCPKSQSPVKVKEPHYSVFPEFRQASYARRYELLLTKLVRERLYDGACLLLTPQPSRGRIHVESPSDELSFRTFVAGMMGRASAFVATRINP